MSKRAAILFAIIALGGNLRAGTALAQADSPGLSYESAYRLFVTAMDGSQPKPEMFGDAYASYRRDFSELRAMSDGIRRASNKNCGRFLSDLDDLHLQTRRMMKTLSRTPAIDFYGQRPLEVARLEILQYLAGNLHEAIAMGLETGSHPLDSSGNEPCSISDRAAWQRASVRTFRSMRTAASTLLGRPSYRQETQLERALAQEAIQRQSFESKASVGLFVISIPVSIFTWWAIPEVAGLALAGRAVTIGRTTAFALRAGGFGAEGLAFNGANSIAHRDDELVRDQPPAFDWEDAIASVEQVLDASVDSPQFEYAAIMQIHAQIAGQVAEAIGPWRDRINQAELEIGQQQENKVGLK